MKRWQDIIVDELLDRLVPDAALSRLGFVRWAKTDARSVEIAVGIVCAGFDVPVTMLDWYTRHGWRSWPSLRELLPALTAQRGGIRYGTLD